MTSYASAPEALIKRFDVPPCPGVISELQAALGKEKPNPAHIARLISRDVGLSGAVMRLVNSPAFRGDAEVASIAEALDMLGTDRIFDLVVGELLRKSIDGDHSLRFDRYWDSAACCAETCAALADRLPGTSRETAYCFGLFHDCGIPLLMRRFPDYRQTLQAANSEIGLGLIAMEEQRHNTNHADIGYLLARTWGLSDVLCEAIRSHHNYEVLDPRMHAHLPDEACTLIALNAIADHVTSLHLRTREEGQWPAARGCVTAFFGLGDDGLDDIVDDLLHDMQKTVPVPAAGGA